MSFFFNFNNNNIVNISIILHVFFFIIIYFFLNIVVYNVVEVLMSKKYLIYGKVCKLSSRILACIFVYYVRNMLEIIIYTYRYIDI